MSDQAVTCANCGGAVLYGYCPDQMPAIYSTGSAGLPVGPAGTVASPKPQPADLEALLRETRERVGQITVRFYAPTVPECTIEWDDDGDAQFVSGTSLEKALRALRAVIDQEETRGG